jgi:uncharacterized membrane protein YgdD (TMEM256/DUF423 family)
MVSASVGAHGLQFHLKSQRVEGQSLSEAQIADKQLDWETAARIQMYHALALLAVGILAAKRCGWAIHLAGLAMTLGTLLFSGCLYAYVLGGPRWLVHVVPIGGLLLIVGWACLAVAACRHQEADAAGQRVV